ITFSKAKDLRENMTEAELLLWSKINKNKLGVRFKPQHPADLFILDFYCHELKLAIELDGESHAGRSEYDRGREAELENYGVKFIRFTNDEVFQNLETVI